MQRPKKPRHYAPSYEWDRYWRELDQYNDWRRQNRQPSTRQSLGQVAVNEAERSTSGHWGDRQIQHEDDETYVKVRPGYDASRDTYTTDVVSGYRNGSSDHQHTVLDENGNVIFDEWRKY